jgi:hypothetical protein
VSRIICRSSIAIAAIMLTAPVVHAGNLAYFHQGVELVRVGDATSGRATRAIQCTEPISEFHGVTAEGLPVVSLGSPTIRPGYVTAHGVSIAVLDDQGNRKALLSDNALRAWPSPSGRRIALLIPDPAGDVSIWENGELRPVPFAAGRVTLVAWAPDERSICVTAYPPDWSAFATNNPKSEDEFFRLSNSDLHLIDLEAGASRQLTSAPGYDYSGVYSPDGGSIAFISNRNGRGAFHLVSLATGETRQITNKISGSYTVPVGRSDTFTWDAASDTIVYEAQEGHKTSSIRAVKPDGSGARTLGAGTQPRVVDGGVVFLGQDGAVKEVKF